MAKISNTVKKDVTIAYKTKVIILGILTIGSFLVVFLLNPIPQSLAFHHFADSRQALGISNFANVVSNLPFILIAIYGLKQLRKSRFRYDTDMAYLVMFIGVLCTGVGSAFYHWNPNNNTLVFDRIPMTLVFMSLLAITIGDFVDRKLGNWLLWPLLLFGILSVLWWHHTEQLGKGDLRLYGLVQFYPMLFIPLILALFYAPGYRSRLVLLAWAVGWYVIAKAFELLDRQFYGLFAISGHTLKHLAAAISTWFLVQTFNAEKSQPDRINST